MLSGGLDSVVLAHELTAKGFHVDPLFFRFFPNYGKQALRAATETAQKLNLQLKVVELDGIGRLMRTIIPEPTLATDEFDTANEDSTAPTAMIMLPAIAIFYAQASESEGLALGVIKNQAERSPGLMDGLKRLPALVELVNSRAKLLPIVLPFAKWTKAEVVRRGEELGVEFGATWSCLDYGSEKQCGTCPACAERKAAFAIAGVADNTSYSK